MKHLLVISLLFISWAAMAQKKDTIPSKMTKQDSINAFVKKRDVFIDSVNSKTSLKEFGVWLDENVSAKAFREMPYSNLYTAFIEARLNEWIRKNKIAIPQN